MKSLAHWATFSPTLHQIQQALGRWVVVGFVDEVGNPYESEATLIVGVLVPATGVSLHPQIFVADSLEGASSPAGYDWEILLDSVRYFRFVDAPHQSIQKSI